jgi:hypothetical protein
VLRRLLLGVVASLTLLPRPAAAQNALTVLDAHLDRPTLIALGVQVLISGDANFDASISVRYRQVGDAGWRDALPLFRVHPADAAAGVTVPAQFAGSIFNLRPGTSYEIELNATDPDGPASEVHALTGATRGVPGDPPSPTPVNVTTAAGLNTALGAAAAGTVITLANGTYLGTFSMSKSGTAQNPIVIRGQTEEGVILDGQSYSGNVIELYGSFIHLENLTIQNANRAVRFQTTSAEGNVVRRVHIKDVTLGIGANADQKDFYLCDNNLEGRLVWPSVYTDDGGTHANDDGIRVQGDGHVVCHNRIIGFGDAMKIEQDGSRAVDFYGNDVLSAYDNGLELDTTTGNGRCLFNRYTNTYATLSFQPVYGGPAYVLRNVVVNVTHEQMKFHNTTSGILVLNNTFVSPSQPLTLSDSTTSHHFLMANNLFIGPPSPANSRTVEWDGYVDDGTFDYNGYYPDAGFKVNFTSGTTVFANFAAFEAGGHETHGRIVESSPFANGLTPPLTYTVTMTPQDVTLAAGGAAVDHGQFFPNITDGYVGAAPDLGALERGCVSPIFGPRAVGTDESNEPFGCDPGTAAPDEGAPGADGAPTDGGTASDAGTGHGDGSVAGDPGDGGGSGSAGSVQGGCSCGAGNLASWPALGVLLLLGRRREPRTPHSV